MCTPETRPAPLRERLLARVARSAAAARVMHTVRHGDSLQPQPAPGVVLHELYRASSGPTRAGEPQRVQLLRVAPLALWQAPASACTREWLVLQGDLTLEGLALERHDYHRHGPGNAQALAAGQHGALLLLREAPARPAQAPFTQRAHQAPWQDYAPGVQRRVLWRDGDEAAMLYRAEAGASVPHHGHGHDEECLPLQGDLFLDDVLLRPLDYQLAPAGSEHAAVFTDTGAVLYAHGDAELALQAA
jgi:quercetin dioxygenase-like cupin family protein